MWGLIIAAANLGQLATFCAGAAAMGGAIVGLLFKGAASAWREERDAAVEKADRLDGKVEELKTKLDVAETRIAELEKRTDYESHADRNTREHREIVTALNDVHKAIVGHTTAVEFLAKQLFATAVIPTPPAA